ncbi:MAG TPA: acetoacetate--CoA ligase, partial [Firmicutes bacterium]|nr:acetoacetate--CoA ligase [Bacillota bacterium]
SGADPWSGVLSGGASMQPPGGDGPRWFTGARLNFAENLLKHANSPDGADGKALVFWNEDGRQRSLSYSILQDEVAQTAAALRAVGVEPGDRVAGYLPNMPETVIAMLAAASLGAVWSSCSMDFGVQGVLDRFGQIEPKVLICADGYKYAGKEIDCLDRVRQIAESIASIERIVVVPYRNASPDLAGIPKALPWDDFRSADETLIEFNHLPFDHPLYIMYSSGTTGLPKCMVHGAGGTLLQHLKELRLHSDLKPGDRIFYFTTCGWMMWNWLVSSLAVGATVVLYDGSPFHPEKDSLWRMAEAEKLTHFGTSAKYLAMLEKHGVRPGAGFDLSQLRSIMSTGSPLAPESYDFVYREIKQDLQLASISGGTDIVSCFALGCPIAPVYRGELQRLGLGMKVEVWNDDGKPIVGQPGELVCTRPFPSMPVYFWNDPDGAKYRSAYFEHFDGVWRHGDWAELTRHGGLIIYGRSDATLNPGGVRIGTAEIYQAVETFPEVLESIVVGQDWEGDVRIVLFVRMAEGHELT